ncbi:MAG: WecB/TagA/CpsF family glycosyltransferase [Burkholderiaceae bacterium]|nr:WecB/TagA/CpsF family glycosyltransferase [Burkholderiaceae bacterium]
MRAVKVKASDVQGEMVTHGVPASAAPQEDTLSRTRGRVRRDVIGVPIDALSWDQALGTLREWSARRDSKVVCIVNAHSLALAREDSGFRQVLAESDMATPDGMPVVWMLRCPGAKGQARIDGPELMWRYCAEAARRGDSIFLYGSTEDTLARLCEKLRAAFPELRIAGTHSPPFRPLNTEEDRAVVRAINASGAGLVFVGLGCPRQERWMREHRGHVRAVMVGVGAAFDFHAGIVRRAPTWMRSIGLEWLFRLGQEPRRLWRRYLTYNTRFMAHAVMQLAGLGRSWPRKSPGTSIESDLPRNERNALSNKK